MIFAPYTPEQVEAKKRQIKETEKKELLIQKGAEWINDVLNNKNGSNTNIDQNIIDKEAEQIANKAIRLGSTTVKEIMVPKVDMVTVTINEETSVIIDRIIDSGHSRYPVLGAERDEVSGILLAKDILPWLESMVYTFTT